MVKDSSFYKKLASYSILATTMLAANRSANAQIIYTGLNPYFVGADTSYLLDLNADGINDYKIVSGGTSKHSNHSLTQKWVNHAFVSINPYSSNQDRSSPFKYEELINSKLKNWNKECNLEYNNATLSTFDGSPLGSFMYTGGPWKYADTSYIPLKLLVAGRTYYGWARVFIQSSEFTLVSYAYNSVAGDSIKAGQTGCSKMPVTPIITKNGDTLISTTAKTYQWYQSGTPLIGDTSNFIIISDNSFYYSVRTTDSNSCLTQSVTFNPEIKSGVNTVTASNEGFIYSYNKTLHVFLFNEKLLGSTAHIYNIDGQEIFTTLLSSAKTIIDLSKCMAGLYVVQIVGTGSSIIKKIIL